jgi:geranylgeranyl reductase family protein
MLDGASDVLIVGAGPTGCAAGITAARAGADVCVVDLARFPRDKVCGDAISNDGMDLVDRLGARAAIDSGPHAVVNGASAVMPDGVRLTRRYDRPGYIVPRLHFDDCLRRALVASGARLVEGVRVASLRKQSGRVSGAEGPAFRWAARSVVAADGYGTVGILALSEKRPKGRYLAVSTRAYYRNVAFPHGPDTADHFFEHSLPYGYAWIFPAVGGLCNVGVYQRADAYARHEKKLDALLEEFVRRNADRFADSERIGRPRAWSLPLSPRPGPLSAPGLFLAGDAAGFVDPLSGEGIWQGIHSGVLAGRLAAESVAGQCDEAELRREYERTCWRVISRKSRSRAWVQAAMATIVDRRLYRLPPVLGALAWGYEHHALEMTKS